MTCGSASGWERFSGYVNEYAQARLGQNYEYTPVDGFAEQTGALALGYAACRCLCDWLFG